MLLTLISAKGSPGVTTTAAALAAVGVEDRSGNGSAQPVDLVELDPAGGDVEPLTGRTGEPGLLRAVADLSPEAVAGNAVDAPPGVHSLLAPTSGFEAASTIGAGLEAWASVLSGLDGTVVVDAGRWEAPHPLAGRITGADVVGLVCRPDSRGVEHLRHIVGRVRELVPVVAIVAVGSRPYRLDEIARYLDIAPGGTVAWDPGGAAALWDEGVGQGRRFRGWRGSVLARSAREVLDGLRRAAAGAVPVP